MFSCVLLCAFCVLVALWTWQIIKLLLDFTFYAHIGYAGTGRILFCFLNWWWLIGNVIIAEELLTLFSFFLLFYFLCTFEWWLDIASLVNECETYNDWYLSLLANLASPRKKMRNWFAKVWELAERLLVMVMNRRVLAFGNEKKRESTNEHKKKGIDPLKWIHREVSWTCSGPNFFS